MVLFDSISHNRGSTNNITYPSESGDLQMESPLHLSNGKNKFNLLKMNFIITFIQWKIKNYKEFFLNFSLKVRIINKLLNPILRTEKWVNLISYVATPTNNSPSFPITTTRKLTNCIIKTLKTFNGRKVPCALSQAIQFGWFSQL